MQAGTRASGGGGTGHRARWGALVAIVVLASAACHSPGGVEDREAGSSSTTRAGSTTSSTPGAPVLRWTPCGQAECAVLTVPRDYGEPGQGSFDLALARRPAERPDLRIGVLFYSAGGPGLGGTAGLINGSARFSVDLRARFDVVSWDPRGVSAGSEIVCVDDPDYFRGLDPTPETLQEVTALEQRAGAFIAGCSERSGDLLPYVGTVASARDLDVLRAALGEEQISYLGVGYGGALGVVYASLFPERVRAMALDGAYDPFAEADVLRAQGAAARERALAAILEDCAAEPLCYFHNAGAAPAAFTSLVTGLDAVPATVAPSLPRVDQGEAWRAVLFALPDELMWTRLTMALAEAQAGEAMELLLLSDESVFRAAANGDAAVAIGCRDWPGRRGTRRTGSFAGELSEVGARLGTEAAAFLCEGWPVEPEPAPAVSGATGGPILVAGVTGDAVASFESSRALAGALPEGVLLEVEGTGHGAYQPWRRDHACAVAVIDWYLISLNLPRDGAVCGPDDGLPQPPG